MNNVIPFNASIKINELVEPTFETPVYDDIKQRFNKLKLISNYNSKFDPQVYRELELRFAEKPPKNGIVYKKAIHDFEDKLTLDSYGNGCNHDVILNKYKEMLTAHGLWNRPFPLPLDISKLWMQLYIAFETDRFCNLRERLQKEPIHLGVLSDPFMWMDRKFKITKEVLRLLDHYNVKYIIHTRSDLIGHDEYIQELNPDLCEINIIISSLNDAYNRLMEPGAPSAKRRLKAYQKLRQKRFHPYIYIKAFPIYEHGYFTDKGFDRENMRCPFEYSTFNMIEELACDWVFNIKLEMINSITENQLRQIYQIVGRDLRMFFNKSARNFIIDRNEQNEYIKRFIAVAEKNNRELKIIS